MESQSIESLKSLVEKLKQENSDLKRQMSRYHSEEKRFSLFPENAHDDFITNVIQSLPHPFRVLNAGNYHIEIENNSAKEFRVVPGKEKCVALKSVVTDLDKINVNTRTIIPFEELKKTGKPVISEYTDERNEIGRQFYEVHCYPLFDNTGHLTRIIEYDLNITARKRIADKIKEREEELQLLSDNISIGMVILFHDIVSWVNRAFVNTFEWQRNEIIGKTLSGIILSSEYPAFINHVDKVIKEKNSANFFETIGVTRFGRCIFLSISIKEIYFGDKRGVQLLFENITERKNAEILAQIQRDLAFRLAASMNLEETLQFCVNAALNAADMEAGGIFLKNRITNELELAHYEGFAEEIVNEFTLSSVQSMKTHGKNQYYTFAELKKYQSSNISEDVKSLGILPLVHEKEMMGCITVVSHTFEMIPETNKNILELIAAQISSAMSRLITEEALKQNEELFRTLYENISDLIIILEKDYHIRFISGSIKKITGYSPAEVMIKGFFSIVDETAVEGIKKALENSILHPGEEKIHQMKIITKTGNQIILESVIVNHLDKPYIKGIIIDSRDVTDRIAAESALRESEERYRSLVENAIDPIFIFHEEKIVFGNRAFQELVGYSIEELNGKDISELFNDVSDKRNNFLKMVDDIFSGKITEMQFETQFVSKEQTNIDLIAGVSSLSVSGKDNHFFICMMKDITEMKKAEAEREKLIRQLERSNKNMEIAYEQVHRAYEKMESYQKELRTANAELQVALGKAEEASKQKSEFLAVISHELRTPLTGILGFSELLSLGEQPRERWKEFGERINRLGKKLLEIINDLLELSIIESGKVKITYSHFNIHEMVADVHAIFEEQFIEKNLQYQTDIKVEELIYSDPVRIRQILLNIIGNAVKFTSAGSIRVDIRREADEYVFAITDTGIGIGNDEQKYIFEMFRQVEGTSNRKYSGSGIGLAICSKLLRILNGKIWVKSKPGQGSTFYFVIPVTTSKPVEFITQKKDQLPIAEIGEFRLLFAEDDENSNRFISEILGMNKNCIYKSFFNGQPLLEEFYNNPLYDIVLLDIQLGDKSGIEIMKEIRQKNKEIPIIAVSAFTMEKDREKYLSLGFNDFISKPIDINLFYDKIWNAVSQYKTIS